MSRTYLTLWLGGLLAISQAAEAAPAQAPAAGADTLPIAEESGDGAGTKPSNGTEPAKKKGGLLGKVKGIAGNKVVQAVAKTAACTMVPGGQVIAGAIDAASSEDVGEAAAGAAGGAGGQTCMPGGLGGLGAGAAVGAGGVPGMAAGGVPGMAGAAGPAGAAGAAGATGLAGAMIGGVPGIAALSSGAIPEGGDGAMPGGPSGELIAGCMGLTAEEYLDFTDPTRGQARQPTDQEMRRRNELAKKVDMGRYQACMMQRIQRYSAGMSATGATMAESGAPAEEDAVADGKLTEAPGKSIRLSSDLAADLAKGRTVMKDVDWLAGGGEVSDAGRAAFTVAMAKLAAAITKAGGTYRADIYLDKRYEDAAVAALGSARLKVVQAALESAGVESGVVTSGKAKKDKGPRLEIVKLKK